MSRTPWTLPSQRLRRSCRNSRVMQRCGRRLSAVEPFARARSRQIGLPVSLALSLDLLMMLRRVCPSFPKNAWLQDLRRSALYLGWSPRGDKLITSLKSDALKERHWAVIFRKLACQTRRSRISPWAPCGGPPTPRRCSTKTDVPSPRRRRRMSPRREIPAIRARSTRSADNAE